jgi:hypothetical protein
MTPEEKFERIQQVFDREIFFYLESRPPLRYRILCKLCRIRPRNEVIVSELEMIYQEIISIWLRDAE